MTTAEVAIAVASGLLINEMTEISPWAARRLVAWSARVKYGTTERGRIRGVELVTLIEERPGKLLKLLTALGFTGAALATVVFRGVGRWGQALGALAQIFIIAVKVGYLLAKTKRTERRFQERLRWHAAHAELQRARSQYEAIAKATRDELDTKPVDNS
jgi:hypothetical protein